MAQVGIKSSEDLSYPVEALVQAQGSDIRVRDVQLVPIIILVQDCSREPEVARPILQASIVITDREVVLQVSVVEVSGVGPFINILGR